MVTIYYTKCQYCKKYISSTTRKEPEPEPINLEGFRKYLDLFSPDQADSYRKNIEELEKQMATGTQDVLLNEPIVPPVVADPIRKKTDSGLSFMQDKRSKNGKERIKDIKLKQDQINKTYDLLSQNSNNTDKNIKKKTDNTDKNIKKKTDKWNFF